jgi:hypothetical protein
VRGWRVAFGEVTGNGRTAASCAARPMRSANATKSARPPQAVTGLSVNVIPIAFAPSNAPRASFCPSSARVFGGATAH